MKLHITKVTKALLQEMGKQLNLPVNTPSDGVAGRDETIFLSCLKTILEFWTLPMCYELQQPVLTYAVVDEEKYVDENVLGGVFNVDKMRTFTVPKPIADGVIEFYQPFLGDWKVIQGNYYGCKLSLNRDSALSQIVISVLVQKLFAEQLKQRPEEEVLVSLNSKKSSLLQYEQISGKIIAMCLDQTDLNKARGYITRFVIDLRSGEVIIDDTYDSVVLSPTDHIQTLDELIESKKQQTRSRSGVRNKYYEQEWDER